MENYKIKINIDEVYRYLGYKNQSDNIDENIKKKAKLINIKHGNIVEEVK